MGIVGRLIDRPQAAITAKQEAMIREIYGGGQTYAGVPMSTDQAMRLVTVHTCVKILSETVKQLPCHLMARDGDSKRKAREHYIYELIHYRPNSWMTAPDFWGMAEAQLALRGNFYAYKTYGTDGRLRELIPLPINAVERVEQKPDYSISYTLKRPDGETVEVDRSRIFHLIGLTLNGYLGVSPIEYARETMGIGVAGERFIAKYFGSGMHPGAIIKHPLALSASAHKNLRENIKEKYQGLGKAHEFMLLDEGMDVSFPPIKLVDQQFLEQMKLTESQICGLFRVPLMLIQSTTNTTTYASAEQFMLSFVVHSLMPILVSFEHAISRDLLAEDERADYYAKFSVDGLLRGDIKTRMEAYGIAIDKEIMNPNEARDLEDLNPYPGGDEYRTRTSTVRKEGGGNES